MASCGTQNTGSNEDNRELSVLDLLIQQDNFDVEDFELGDDYSVAGGGPDADNPDSGETNNNDEAEDDSDIVIEEEEVVEEDEVPQTGEMIEIRTTTEYNAYVGRFVDKYATFSESTDDKPLYPSKIFSRSKYAKDSAHYVIVNPTTVNRMCEQIQTDPKCSTAKLLVIHINVGASTHHGYVKGQMLNDKWRHPGYHLTIDAQGNCNKNRLDDENSYGCGNAIRHYLPFRQNKNSECSGRKSTVSNIINVCWLGHNTKNRPSPYAAKTSKDKNKAEEFLIRATMSKKQAHSLGKIVKAYIKRYPNIKVCGHNQLGPQKKECPCFNVPEWAELCGIPSKNIYTTFSDLGLIDGRVKIIKDGKKVNNPNLGKAISKRTPHHWTTKTYTSSTSYYVKNAKILFDEMGNYSSWNINPPATPTNDDNSTPTNENNNNEEEVATRWQDMDCNEFASFWHGLNSRGRTNWAMSLRSDDGDENENGESSADAADRLCRECKDEINGD